jgi:hypothetical protein
MRREQAEQAVQELLDKIDKQKWRDVRIPWGFEIDSVESEEESKVFASSLRHWLVTVRLSVPVLYDYTTGRGAHLPVKTDNLDALKAHIDALAQQCWARMHLMDWKVEPDEPHDPEAPDGDTAEESWTVSVGLEVA